MRPGFAVARGETAEGKTEGTEETNENGAAFGGGKAEDGATLARAGMDVKE